MDSARAALASVLRFVRRPAVVAPVIGLLVALALFGLRSAGELEELELDAYDWYQRTQPHPGHADPRVVIIGITDEEMDLYGHPLKDETLALALETLLEARPRAIGVDIYRTHALPPGEARLKKVILENPEIVFVEKFGEESEGGLRVLDWMYGGSIGVADVFPDRGAVVRRVPLLLWDENRVYKSLSLSLAEHYLDDEHIQIQQHPEIEGAVVLGQTLLTPLVPDSGAYADLDSRGFQYLLDFAAGPDGFRSYTLREVIEGELGPGPIHDRVVLIGTTAVSVKDDFYTPFSAGRDAEQRLTMYGIDVHAHAVSQLLRHALEGDKQIGSISETSERVLGLVFAMLGALLGLWRRSLLTASVLLAALGGLLATGWLAFYFRYWIPVVPAALGWVIAAGAVLLYTSSYEGRERALVERMLGAMTGAPVAANLLKERDVFMRGGRLTTQKLYLTVMLTDLKGFTGASEDMQPDELMQWVNEYMDLMAGLVEDHGGVVDDFAGDGIKANFGVPIPRSSEVEMDEDASNAVVCALEMGRKMVALNADWEQQGRPTGRMRVGIFSGPAVVGMLGSQARQKYTSVGDTVNTSARLESFDKESFAEEEGVAYRILVGEDTFKRLGDRFKAEFLGTHALRGKEQKIGIYRIYGSADSKLG